MNRRVQIFALLVFGAIVAIVAHPVLAIPDLVYPLDAVERTVSPRGKVRCPKVELETYRGTSIRYRRPVKIYVGFKSHLAAFEEVVREVALSVEVREQVRHAAPLHGQHDRRDVRI